MGSHSLGSDAPRAGWASLPGLACEVYVAAPDGPARGAVLVGAEIFGVTAYVRGICARPSGLGYAAAAPDLYWRDAPRLELSYDDAGRTEGFDAPAAAEAWRHIDAALARHVAALEG